MNKMRDDTLETQSNLSAFNTRNIWCGSMITVTVVVHGFIVRGGIMCRDRQQSSVSLFATSRHIMSDGGPTSWKSLRNFVSNPATPHLFGVDSATAYLGCKY